MTLSCAARRIAVVPAAMAAAALAAVLPAVAATDPAVAIAQSLAAGDGPGAAQQIESAGFEHDSRRLAHVIVEGGHLAVRNHNGDGFRDAVAFAFPHSGVPFSGAMATFGLAATEVAATGVTPDEALVGGETIAATTKAYLI
ncbi:hypothetical protein HFP15_29680 [Amycolatopsis sp. K13G38]|uniref:Uncharacterized protein n=1 Tax=Amycolatopsis acididurans TaxID=2724524 RepID=A0ABX1JBB5_9PSEU|nr:hypothetical protein [Amycolatopsis acididurans]NKQ57048.1 hypothetical protein [Amycolatopsis acididurans]